MWSEHTTKNCKGPGRTPRKWSRQIGWGWRDVLQMTPAQLRRARRALLRRKAGMK